jgi:uncharacterized protein YqeY
MEVAMILDKLTEDMKKAMKDGDKTRLSVIRMLRSEIKNAQIAAGGELEASEEEKVLNSYARKRRESVEKYREGGREDLAEKEELEYEITVSYLPPRMDESEIRTLIEKHIEETGAVGMGDFGRVMKAVMTEVGSRADGSEIQKLVKEMLSSSNG